MPVKTRKAPKPTFQSDVRLNKRLRLNSGNSDPHMPTNFGNHAHLLVTVAASR